MEDIIKDGWRFVYVESVGGYVALEPVDSRPDRWTDHASYIRYQSADFSDEDES